jgi:hypothetical protein
LYNVTVTLQTVNIGRKFVGRTGTYGKYKEDVMELKETENAAVAEKNNGST